MLTKTVAIEEIRPGGEINSRTSNQTTGIADLVASIKAHGLLQPLVCDRAVEGEHEVFRVVDGNRRFAALKKIHGKKTTDVPIVVIDGNAREASLVANVIRADIHPVDEYRAFAALVAEGLSVEEIAKRFNKKARWVEQRLGLSALAPELLDLWLGGKLTEEQAEALTLAPSHEDQVNVWNRAKGSSDWNLHPDRLRDSIRRNALCEKDDSRLIYVGVEAYRAAGGTFRGDLFSADQYPDNPSLLDRLVAEKADAAAEPFRKAGWAWVEINPKNRWQYRDADWRDLATPEEQAAHGKTQTWQGKKKIIDRVFERAETVPEIIARYGVVLYLASSGELRCETFQTKPEERQAAIIHHDDDGDDGDEPETGISHRAEPPKPRISAALTESLSEVMTVALSKAVCAAPEVALSMLLATLKVKLTSYQHSPVMLAGTPWRGIALERADNGENLDWVEEFAGAQAMDLDAQVKALSGLVASLLDLREMKVGTPAQSSRNPAVKAIASALFAATVRAEIAAAFDPVSYFSKVSSALIDEACVEMGVEPPKGKKSERVEAAAAFALNCGWLPPELRTVHYDGPASSTDGSVSA